MKVETYKQTYHNPVAQIPVPAEFALMGNFDVIFIKRLEIHKLINQLNFIK